MLKKLLTYALSLTVLLTVGAHLALADTSSEAANRAATYLLDQRDSSGNIGGVSYSGWAIQGIAAAGKTSPQTLTYLENNLGDIQNASATDIERTILAVLAGGRDPRNFGGKDLIAILKTKVNNSQIGEVALTNDDIFGILALLASGESITDPIVTNAIQYLVSTQRADGSFSWSSTGEGDSNDTAAAIQALRLAQKKGYTGNLGLSRARSYLVSVQNNDGGFSYQPTFESDGTTTAWVIIAITALNEAPESWVKNGNQPLGYLQSLQTETGGVQWQAGSGPDSYTTAFAAIALSGKALPVAVMTIEPSPTPVPTPSPTPEPTPSPTPSPSPSPEASPSPSPTATVSPRPSIIPTATPSPTPSASVAPTPTPSPSVAPTPTPVPSVAPTPTPAVTPSTNPSPQPSPTPVTTLTVVTQATPPTIVAASPNNIAPRRTVATRTTTVTPAPDLTAESTRDEIDDTVIATTADDLRAETSLTPTPTPDTTFEPLVKADQTENPTPSTIAAALLVLLGLLLVAWGIVTLVKRRMRNQL